MDEINRFFMTGERSAGKLACSVLRGAKTFCLLYCTYGSEEGETRSYDPTPSREDIEVTKRLVECGKILGIELLDHLVIGDQKFISLKEKGYI